MVPLEPGRRKSTLKCENDMFVLEVGPTLVCGHGNGRTEKDDHEKTDEIDLELRNLLYHHDILSLAECN